ncbi:hypothetical protein B9Z55_027987 [Caenorhabditis nigoni]|nr:hypothetical protein B9Z55_027987 [Caenorhabditis nigoni]
MLPLKKPVPKKPYPKSPTIKSPVAKFPIEIESPTIHITKIVKSKKEIKKWPLKQEEEASERHLNRQESTENEYLHSHRCFKTGPNQNGSIKNQSFAKRKLEVKNNKKVSPRRSPKKTVKLFNGSKEPMSHPAKSLKTTKVAMSGKNIAVHKT